ncbi:hypothetical protein ARMGADRAFT_1038013 [Armillaria gallica]|uniref:Uncharacterized protein n=1 Tax=Armillaria gallica TaxID=47427 RepID=A0A2H3CVJ3_ARMGA|nr:hypothetical protein ARMGADRAFT_1038013 [Armillaria gallica]
MAFDMSREALVIACWHRGKSNFKIKFLLIVLVWIRNGKHMQVSRQHSMAVYNDCVELPEDFKPIISHKASISSSGHMVEAPRSPQKGCMTWVMGDCWAPEDNTEIFLDATNAGYFTELTGEVYDSWVFQQANPTQKGKRKCTKVSVNGLILSGRIYTEVNT